jgi:hypothetical protein
LLAATLYQGNHDRNHKLWNNGYAERYTGILYPIWLAIKDTTDIARSASYLDVHLKIDSE